MESTITRHSVQPAACDRHAVNTAYIRTAALTYGKLYNDGKQPGSDGVRCGRLLLDLQRQLVDHLLIHLAIPEATAHILWRFERQDVTKLHSKEVGCAGWWTGTMRRSDVLRTCLYSFMNRKGSVARAMLSCTPANRET